jgi:hypothetical protein
MILQTIADNSTDLDWTSIILGAITSGTAMFAAWMAKQAASQSRVNNRLLKTNSGMTIGEHIEALRGEIEIMTEEKTKADAQLVAAALAAVAKLAVTTEPPRLTDQAVNTASDLITKAEQTAARLKEGDNP